MDTSYKRRLITRISAEQGGLCCYCKRSFTPDGATMATLEHKKAKMDGGRDCVANFAVACFHCNQHRGAQMNSARQAKRRNPTPPAPP